MSLWGILDLNKNDWPALIEQTHTYRAKIKKTKLAFLAPIKIINIENVILNCSEVKDTL